MEYLLAEDLLLLVLDPATGKPTTAESSINLGLAGALLRDLELNGCLDIGPRSRWTGSTPLAAGAVDPPAQLLLAWAWQRAVGHGSQRAIERCAPKLRAKVTQDLIAKGRIIEHSRPIFWVFTQTRWRPSGGEDLDLLRTAVIDGLLADHPPTPRIRALICLLQAIKAEQPLLPPERRREGRQRATEWAQDDWAASAVRGAISAASSDATAIIAAGT